MDIILDAIKAILSVMGMTPTEALALGFNAVMGLISVPITNWLKPVLAKVPFLPTDAVQTKVSGWVTIVVSGFIGVGFMLAGKWIFGLEAFNDAGIYQSLVYAFGINGTFAAIFFEWNKTRKARAGGAVTAP